MFRKKGDKITIEYIENKYGIKLTYPFQYINAHNPSRVYDNEVSEYYSEIEMFGCSEVFINGRGTHKDCRSKCEECNFYPIVKAYEDSKTPEEKKRSEEFQQKMKKMLLEVFQQKTP